MMDTLHVGLNDFFMLANCGSGGYVLIDSVYNALGMDEWCFEVIQASWTGLAGFSPWPNPNLGILMSQTQIWMLGVAELCARYFCG